jgi:hypothetical protein
MNPETAENLAAVLDEALFALFDIRQTAYAIEPYVRQTTERHELKHLRDAIKGVLASLESIERLTKS